MQFYIISGSEGQDKQICSFPLGLKVEKAEKP